MKKQTHPALEPVLAACPREAVCNMLDEGPLPMCEAVMLSRLFPDAADLFSGQDAELLVRHFALFHRLYELQEEYRREEVYLYVHFMRTTRLPFPGDGACGFFLEERLDFCRRPARDGYCPEHHAIIADAGLDRVSARYYYLDPANYDTLARIGTARLLDQTAEALLQYDDIRRAYHVLGVSPEDSHQLIKRKFRDLARDCHPDMAQGNAARFTRINNAYHLITRFYDTLHPADKLP